MIIDLTEVFHSVFFEAHESLQRRRLFPSAVHAVHHVPFFLLSNKKNVEYFNLKNKERKILEQRTSYLNGVGFSSTDCFLWVAVISAKKHKRQRRKRQSVTPTREESENFRQSSNKRPRRLYLTIELLRYFR